MSPVPDFDLQPDPRILPMLGEINLVQWRCIAELIDNGVDGFLDVVASGGTLEAPEVHVMVPTTDAPSAVVSVTDNGPGMTPEVLEKAVRAGWSGNESITGKLGLFGMGFNIATARLGTVTTVWTTKAGDKEWVGVRIDFDQLRTQRHFRTPRLSQPKLDPAQHGTKVIIEKLKPEQRQWFSKTSNRSSVKRELGRVYSSMLQPGGLPLQFRLFYETKLVEGRRHCIWSGPTSPVPRTVDTRTRFGIVDAYQPLDVRMEDRPYCVACWQWLAVDDAACPMCGKDANVVKRRRSIRGWVGIQRYLSETEFGIDFLRNGRKIEIGNKDLFVWSDGDSAEPEYPIDDPRNRGRIVGEIHLDHCRVTYTKDRFERTDPAWDDMVRVVRGEGPLRPDRAQDLGFGPNTSPLFKLFNLFRRSTPRSKTAGAWSRLLVVPDNNIAEEMARRFHQGDPAYETDQKWWEIVEQEDKKLLGGTGPAGGGGATGGTGIPGFGSPGPGTPGPSAPYAGGPGTSGGAPTTTPPAPPPRQTPIASLSHRYSSATTSQNWNVQAYSVDETHPNLDRKRPWAIRVTTAGVHEFFVDERHGVFESATITPLDALLAELAHSALEELRDIAGDATFGSVLADLRKQYATVTALDPAALSLGARQTLGSIAQAVARQIEPADAPTLFRELSPDAQRATLERMVKRGATNPQSIIAAGRFLEYAPAQVVRDFFDEHPELFLDGKCWDDPYSALNFEDPSTTELARSQVIRRYDGLLDDAVWLAEQDPTDLRQASRPKLLRAVNALELLAPIEPVAPVGSPS